MRAHACDLTERDRQTLEFYRQCKAVGRFPDDPLVRFFAVAIAEAEQTVEREERRELRKAIATLTERLKEKGKS